MWISKKRFKAIEKRIADLEVQIHSQQAKTINQIRKEYGLKPINEKHADNLLIKA